MYHLIIRFPKRFFPYAEKFYYDKDWDSLYYLTLKNIEFLTEHEEYADVCLDELKALNQLKKILDEKFI